jgi:kanamycin kinase/aminoglycoside 3'-phosphotransferase-2
MIPGLIISTMETPKLAKLPQAIAPQLTGYEAEPITIGMSGAGVYRLGKPGEPRLILKIRPDSDDPDPGFRLALEAEKMRWLSAWVPVPGVLEYSQQDGSEYLLMTEIVGRSGAENWPPEERPRVVVAIAEALKWLHSIPLEHCPFDQQLEAKLTQARLRTELGLVDIEDFDDQWQGKPAEELLEVLLQTRPADEDLVVCHGDYCLPNVLLHEGKLSGFVDLGRLGVADRYQDLALMTRSLTSDLNPQFGEGWDKVFLEAYGIREPDWTRLEFYRLLDEFF